MMPSYQNPTYTGVPQAPPPGPPPGWAQAPPSAPVWQAQGQLPLPPVQRVVPAPRAIVRGVAAETPSRLVMPSPDALGIRVATAPVAVDWNAAHARLERLQAVRFQSERLREGGFRVTFLLPDGTDATRTIDASAATESAAVHLALERAETSVQSRR